jgi:hypothetical protein
LTLADGTHVDGTVLGHEGMFVFSPRTRIRAPRGESYSEIRSLDVKPKGKGAETGRQGAIGTPPAPAWSRSRGDCGGVGGRLIGQFPPGQRGNIPVLMPDSKPIVAVVMGSSSTGTR